MPKTAYLFLATGFEEIEAITTIDLLRRAGIACITVALGDSLQVAGAHHIPVIADQALSSVNLEQADALILPGGLPGVTNLNESTSLRQLITEGYKAGKLIAAICAAPMILGQLGILQGKEATTYPSFEPHLEGYIPTERSVAVSGQVITARSAGVTIPFALAIITQLLGQDVADEVRSAIIYEG